MVARTVLELSGTVVDARVVAAASMPDELVTEVV